MKIPDFRIAFLGHDISIEAIGALVLQYHDNVSTRAYEQACGYRKARPQDKVRIFDTCLGADAASKPTCQLVAFPGRTTSVLAR
jgi:hypothetical protein